MRLFLWYCVLAVLQSQPVLAAQAPSEEAAAVRPSGGTTILARVNGTPITEQQVLRRLQAVHGDVEPYRKDPNRWQRMLEAGIEAEIRDRLLLQTAIAEKLEVREQEVQEARARSRKLLGEDRFRSMLEKRDATEADYNAFLRERLLINQYKARLFKGMSVDEETLRSYYAGHQKLFTQPRRVQLETTRVQNPQAARELLKSLKTAGDGGSLPGQDDDKAGAEENTRHGWAVVDDLPPGLRISLETAKAGDVLEPVDGDGRTLIIRVLAIEEERPLSFEEARKGLEARFLRRRQESLLDDWYTQASQHAAIEYLPLP